MTDICNVCRQYTCKCAATVADIDAWCDAHLESPAMEEEYARRKAYAKARLETYEKTYAVPPRDVVVEGE